MAEYEGKLVEIIVGKPKSRIAGEEKLEAEKRRETKRVNMRIVSRVRRSRQEKRKEAGEKERRRERERDNWAGFY